MQEKNISPIEWLEDLCVCDKEGRVKIFPDLETAVIYRDLHTIDGKVVELPVY